MSSRQRIFFAFFLISLPSAPAESVELEKLPGPILIRGDETTAFRDPAVVYENGVFYLFCTKVSVEENGDVFSYTVRCTSTDLRHWTEPVVMTPRDQDRNYSSPGNVIRFKDQWILCLQTYPRPGAKWTPEGKPVFANDKARLFVMRSPDLVRWSEPELLRVLGPDVPEEKMKRMIDPYLLEDLQDRGKYWCFYKIGREIGYSHSTDLVHWTYHGQAVFGENPCVIVQDGKYRLYYSPENGMGCRVSDDLVHWTDAGPTILLGQEQWPWAQGRLTAGFVLDLTMEPSVGKYLMFFHGSPGPAQGENITNFDIRCHIGLAWSDDLETWHWPDTIAR